MSKKKGGDSYSTAKGGGKYRIYKNGVEVWASEGQGEADRQLMNAELIRLLKEPKSNDSDSNTGSNTSGDANDTQIGLTKEQADQLILEQGLADYFRAEARRQGRDASEIAQEAFNNPDTLPEPIKNMLETVTETGEKTLTISDEMQNRVFDRISGKDLLNDLTGEIEERQQDRRTIFEELQDLSQDYEKKNSQTLDRMVDPDVGAKSYQDIWGNLSEDQKKGLTPQGMHQLNTMQGLDTLRGNGQQQSSLYNSLMPKEGNFSVDWGQNPTYERAKGIYDSDFKPNYAYSSTEPYNDREHQLAAMGQAKGSSALEENSDARQRAMHKEDLENIFNIQRMLQAEHQARGETLGQMERLGNAGRDALGQPIEKSENILGKQFDRDTDQTFKQNEFKKDLAEGGMSLNTAEMQDASSLYNLLNAQNQEVKQEDRAVRDGIYNYLMTAEQLRKGGEVEKKQLQQMEQNLWAQRMDVLNQVRQLNLQERGLDLQERQLEESISSGNMKGFFEALGAIAPAALAAVIPGGGAAMALATLAPNVTKMADFGKGTTPNQGWFNNKAK